MSDETTVTSQAASQTSSDTAAETASSGDSGLLTADQPGQEAAGESQESNGSSGSENKDTPAGAPEAYEPFTLPGGMEMDGAVLEEFQTLARELNLPQEKAQSLATLGGKMAAAWQDKLSQALAAQKTQWAEAARADKDYGGDALGENLAIARTALDAFSGPEFTKFLNETGLASHPEMIRAFWKIGQATSADTFVGGKPAQSQTLAQKHYPNSPNLK